jgi:putative ABC transport system permease protein
MIPPRDESDLDRELREEIESHIRMRAEHDGVNQEQARRRFGNTGLIQEEMRSMHISNFVDEIRQDLRYALRRAIRMPGFTLAVIGAIALGIGSSTAVFSVVDRILFRSLPFANEEQLVWLGMTAPLSADEFMLGGDYFEWKDQQQSFSHFTGSTGGRPCDVTESNPVRLNCFLAAYDFLDTFGYKPQFGRMFKKDDDRPDAPKVMLISHGLWQSRFGGQPDVLEKTIELDNQQWRVIGVLPQHFEVPNLSRVDILRPMALDEARERVRTRGQMYLQSWARLKPGVSIQQAEVSLAPLFQQSLKHVPRAFVKEVKLKVTPFRTSQSRDVRAISIALLAAVLCVLLIACANVANLLLARATASARESAIRSAIGASRARLIRQHFTESLLLSAAGGLCGLALGLIFLKLATHFAPPGIPRLQEASLDLRVLSFAALLTILCGLVCGIAPAFRGIDAGMLAGMRVTSSRVWTRPALVTLQIALATALLYVTTLLGESLWKMQNVRLGITTENVISVPISLSRFRYGQPAQRTAFWEQLEQRIPRLPGMENFTLSDSLPPTGRTQVMIFSRIQIDGKAEDLRGGTRGMATLRNVMPSYFELLKIQLLQGRIYTNEDRAVKDPGIVIDHNMAQKLYGSTTAVGRRVKPGPDAPWLTVLGVVDTVRNAGLETGDPEYYYVLPKATDSWGLNLVVRTTGDPKLVTSLIRSEIASIDPHIPLNFETMEQRTSKLTERPRFNAGILGFFSLAGLLLGATGIYGVVSFLVSQRTKEIGVRMALGATARQIRGLVLRNALIWTAAGCLAGSALVILVLPYLRELLYQTQPARPLAGAAVLLCMAVVAILAAMVPAVRASKLDPMQTLRQD